MKVSKVESSTRLFGDDDETAREQRAHVLCRGHDEMTTDLPCSLH